MRYWRYLIYVLAIITVLAHLQSDTKLYRVRAQQHQGDLLFTTPQPTKAPTLTPTAVPRPTTPPLAGGMTCVPGAPAGSYCKADTGKKVDVVYNDDCAAEDVPTNEACTAAPAGGVAATGATQIISQLVDNIQAVCKANGVPGRVNLPGSACIPNIHPPTKPAPIGSGPELQSVMTREFLASVNESNALQCVRFAKVASMFLTGCLPQRQLIGACTDDVPVGNAIDYSVINPVGFTFFNVPATPQVGDLAVFKYSGPYGHIGIVMEVRANSFVIAEANFDSAGTVTKDRIVPFDYPYLVGYSHKQ